MIAMATPMARANTKASVYNEVCAEAMNTTDGVLHALVRDGIAQCAEASADRTMSGEAAVSDHGELSNRRRSGRKSR